MLISLGPYDGADWLALSLYEQVQLKGLEKLSPGDQKFYYSKDWQILRISRFGMKLAGRQAWSTGGYDVIGIA